LVALTENNSQACLQNKSKSMANENVEDPFFFRNEMTHFASVQRSLLDNDKGIPKRELKSLSKSQKMRVVDEETL
jgi:predicted ATPase